MAEDKVYLSRLYKAKCSRGTMENYLNVVKDHGIVWITKDEPQGTYDNLRPFLNACDFHAQKNVIHFGRCNSSDNPGNIVDAEEALMDALIPGSRLIKSLLGCSGCKCKPIITDSWGEVDDSHLVSGVSALTEDSKLYCRNGGVIEICPVTEQV